MTTGIEPGLSLDELRALCKEQERKIATYEAVFATTSADQGQRDPDRTVTVCSVPGNAWDVVINDRDEWKRRAVDAEMRIDKLARSYGDHLATWMDRVRALEEQLVAANRALGASEAFARKLELMVKPPC